MMFSASRRLAADLTCDCLRGNLGGCGNMKRLSEQSRVSVVTITTGGKTLATHQTKSTEPSANSECSASRTVDRFRLRHCLVVDGGRIGVREGSTGALGEGTMFCGFGGCETGDMSFR